MFARLRFRREHCDRDSASPVGLSATGGEPERGNMRGVSKRLPLFAIDSALTKNTHQQTAANVLGVRVGDAQFSAASPSCTGVHPRIPAVQSPMRADARSALCV